MTKWSIRILNAVTFPYTWDLIDTQKIALLDQAYENYQQTGNLTAPILQNHTEKQPAMLNLKMKIRQLSQSSNSFRQPINGSQKRRARKEKAAEAAEKAVSTATVSNVQLLGPEANVTYFIENDAEEQQVGSKAETPAPIDGKKYVGKASNQSLNPDSALRQASGIEHNRPTSAPSPPLSPTQEIELAPNTGLCLSIGTIVSSPVKSLDGKAFIDTDVSDQADVHVQQDFEALMCDPGSATLAPVTDHLVVEQVDCAVDAAGVAFGSPSQLQQAKRKRRNKKGKQNKTKLTSIQSVRNDHDADSGGTMQFDIETKLSNEEHPEVSNDLAPCLEDDSFEASLSESNRFDLSHGIWSSIGTTHALFIRNETGTRSVYPRNARVERYLRQQERVLAARAETEERQKQAKIKQQARKARQILLRRGRIADNSPLSRAMSLPRNNINKEAKSQSRSPSPKLDEEMAQNQIEYYKHQDKVHRLEERKRQITLEYDRELEEHRGFPRAADLPDDDADEREKQLNLGRAQGHGSNLSSDIDSDDASVDSLDQGYPESTIVEGFEKELDRHVRRYGLSVKLHEGDREPYRFESVGPQPNDEVQQAAEDDSHPVSNDSEDENRIPKLGSPVSPVFVTYGEQTDEIQNNDAGTTHSNRVHESELCEESCPERIQGRKGVSSDVVVSPEGDPHSIYPEHSPSRQPVSQFHDTDKELASPAMAVSLCMPSNILLSRRPQDWDPSERNQCSAGICTCGATQHSQEVVQLLTESDQRSRESGRPSSGDGQLAPEGNQGGHWSGQRGHRSSRGRGQSSGWRAYAPALISNHGTCYGGQPSPIAPRVEQTENPWAIAVQADDRELMVQSVERRLALEQDMQAKGTTYTDCAGPIEDVFTKVDQDRKPVDQKIKKVIGRRKAEDSSLPDVPVLVPEATGASRSGTKVGNLLDVEHV